ncbi:MULTISPECIES: hypothetical protein [unclassified Bradyrhizobium]
MIVALKSERSLGKPVEELFNRFLIDDLAGDGMTIAMVIIIMMIVIVGNELQGADAVPGQ